ncbi:MULTISPECIES: ABC transporter ATP-binding protein [Rhizobium]|uniref:ABC transporter ATP-binding protein n=1 Tax=Rhizobium changzhiense TaxID=2692317 RepID=A0A7Z0ZW51_9HYPH|nr:ABC transporter ATP-binding protein [Rhizobium sp. BT-226]MBA5800520.1 ABC transporter ATP-binding protein [Rhizobium changzhiense]MCH4547347.1 ABC transporter ATP-binding protein [Rhizobium changzhiense]MCW0019142.1 ABC transporter ATP-binding protein [Rhizobium sp. BT-226]NNU48932.1 ABC transporter ATP-binding protein [Rhizobium changzhiense]NZD65992.1 ABC transporter ATP-binding protein [Rhizobium changzhiense]
MNLLDVCNVTTGYGATFVNRDVSVTLGENEVITILGPNGAGKSTLLRTIVGLVKPRTGTITFAGENLTGRTPDIMAKRGVVLVPEGRRIFGDMTVEENLRLGAYARRDTEAVEADVKTMESFFPILATKRQQKGGSLSGGQQQMLAIARGLMARPRVLLLDEPSLGLSPLLVKEIQAIILDIGKTFNASVLLVEQNAGLALSVATRGYLMQNGRIATSGPISDLKDMSLMRELYLGGVAEQV